MARVALADDHAVLRDGLRRILEPRGHEIVAEISTGLDVEAAVAAVKPDALILDLGLPSLHGLDVLRGLARHGGTKVLVLSAEDRPDFVVDALKNGAKGYVLKSCSAIELVAAVETVAAGGHYVSSELSGVMVRTIETGGESQEDPYDALSNREREVFHAMAEGLSNAQIGERLFISMRTAEAHRLRVMKRLSLRSQTDIVLYALRRGVISLG
jgi:DNA-binding NarL/FixJ family response regulator